RAARGRRGRPKGLRYGAATVFDTSLNVGALERTQHAPTLRAARPHRHRTDDAGDNCADAAPVLRVGRHPLLGDVNLRAELAEVTVERRARRRYPRSDVIRC